jgi:hypothetical protein
VSRPERMESVPVPAWRVVYQPGDGTRYGLLVAVDLTDRVTIARSPRLEGAGPWPQIIIARADVDEVLGTWEPPPERDDYQMSAEEAGVLARAAEYEPEENAWTVLACLVVARAALRGEL